MWVTHAMWFSCGVAFGAGTLYTLMLAWRLGWEPVEECPHCADSGWHRNQQYCHCVMGHTLRELYEA